MGGYYQRQDDMEGVGMSDMHSTPEPSVAASILHEAATIVDGARQQTHGDRERSFGMIAALWSEYVEFPITAQDAAVMMALLKFARAKCGAEACRDHFTDAAGYAALAGELAGVGE